MRLLYRPVIAIVLLFPGLSVQAQQDLPPPNILWITSEDNSPFLGCYGDSFATTPNLDALAAEGVRYMNAYAPAPVCAPTRSSIITGMYASSLGTENMRSFYKVPEQVRLFPEFLQEAGYYTTNNHKQDYNMDPANNRWNEGWDESSPEATYANRAEGQPFFAIFNFTISHESRVHTSTPAEELRHDPETVPIPPYHPRTEEMKHDWAQYYDKVEDMDAAVGQVLSDLEAAGLADRTIVFYYSDHGGVLGRSKRFMFESGLRVPLIIRVPEAYQHLIDVEPGGTSDRMVSFVDFAPTVLTLAGLPLPDQFQGQPIMGEEIPPSPQYAFSFRSRMDEVYDLARSARNERFRYVRNYNPHKIYGQYLSYLWRAPSMASWAAAYEAGETNEVQSAFFREKPVEELYDCWEDPHNVNNLADDPAYAEVLMELRLATQNWMRDIRDIGLLPEAEMIRRAGDSTIFEYAQGQEYDFDLTLAAAEVGASRDPHLEKAIIPDLTHPDPVVRYWAVMGIVIRDGQLAGKDKSDVLKLLGPRLRDENVSVRLAAAEAAYLLGETRTALNLIRSVLRSGATMDRVHALNIVSKMGEDGDAVYSLVQKILDPCSGPQWEQPFDCMACRAYMGQRE